MRGAVGHRRAALAGLVLVGAALRFATLGARSYWFDEAATVHLVRRSFGAMLRGIPASEGTPPLYYLLADGWAAVFGTGEVGLRSLSAVFGTLTIPVAYAAARRAVSVRAGLVAAALAAVSPPLVWFAQDARTYALAVLLAGVAFVCFLRARDAREGEAGRELALWALAATASIAAHYFAAFPVAAEAVLLLRPARGRRRAAAAVAAPAAASAALAVLAWAQRDHGGAFISGSARAPRLARLVPEYLVGFQPPAQIVLSALAALLLVPVAWLLWRRTDARERAGARVGAIVGGTAVLVPVAMAFLPHLDYLIPRNTMTAWVPLAVVAAAGLGARRAGGLGAATLAALCVLSVAVNVVTADRPKFEHDDWRSAARALGPCRGDRVLVVSPASGAAVLPLYLPATTLLRRPGTVRAARIRADALALVGLPPSFRTIGVASVPPRPRSPAPPPGFRAAGREERGTFTLVRYRAVAPVGAAASTGALARLGLRGDEGVAVLLQRCD